MAECKNEEKNCFAEQDDRMAMNYRLEQELFKCESDNKNRCSKLLDQLDQIKELDQEIFRKQMTMHVSRPSVDQESNADPVEKGDNLETTKQNRVDQMIANYEHHVRKMSDGNEQEPPEATMEEKDIQGGGSLKNWSECLESLNEEFRDASKHFENRLNGNADETDSQDAIDAAEGPSTRADNNFESKKMHFENLIQKDLIITKQELNKRQKLLKKK